ITSVGIYLQSRLAYQGSRYSTVTGKGFRPRTMDLGNWRYLTAALLIIYFVIIVLLPFLVLVWSSLQKFYSAPSWAALNRLSLDSYRTILDYPQFWSTLRNSLLLALTTATVIMLVGAVTSWAVVRTKIRGHERRVLGHDVPPRHFAIVEAGAARRLDLCGDRLDPRTVELDPALQSGHRGGVDHDLGAVAERPICGALRARRHADHPVVL